MKRLLIDCAVLILTFLLPWWLSVLVAVLCAFYFDNYFEIILFGLAIDSTYNIHVRYFYGLQLQITLLCLILSVFIFSLKRRLRFYTQSSKK